MYRGELERWERGGREKREGKEDGDREEERREERKREGRWQW